MEISNNPDPIRVQFLNQKFNQRYYQWRDQKPFNALKMPFILRGQISEAHVDI